MKVYKDNEHSVSLAPFALPGGRHLMVSVGLFAAFDLEAATPCSVLRTEQDFWKEAPEVFAALGRPPVVDANLPKAGAEVLVAGFCRSPGKLPVPAQEVAFRVGGVRRRLAVFGDRLRLPGGGATEPAPFTAMPLTWERAFGGPDFAANPEGRGLIAGNKPSENLPNLEDPNRLICGRDDRPRPACPFAVDVANEERHALSGTYNQHWLETRWPGYPDDCHPDFFFSAQPEQRLAGSRAYFQGDEEIELIGMHHDYPHMRSRLPGRRVRAFVTTAAQFRPFAGAAPAGPGEPAGPDGTKVPLPYAKDLAQPGLFTEVELRCDTVWLLPDLAAAFVLYRGLLPVADDEMDDILRVYVVTEKLEQAPLPPEHYLEEQKKRVRPVVEIDLAPLVEAQAKTTKAVKMARDVPKTFERLRRDFLGESPAMPFSLGDMAHSSRKTLATARATLDALERQMLEQRAQFSHLAHFDLSPIAKMRAVVNEQEQALEKMLRQGAAIVRRGDRTVARAKENAAARWKDLAARTPEGTLPPLADALAKLDALTPTNMLARPESLNPWHDHGFSLLVEARRTLRRHDALLDFLASLGLEERTLENAWIGYGPEDAAESPQQWGLPPGPDFVLPAGLYVPRFSGKALTALTVYPLRPEDIARRRFDPPASFSVPGSDSSPLSLPASYPGGAVLAVPDDLCAVFAEQETGDFCHIVAAAAPSILAAAKDLPPLAPAFPPPLTPPIISALIPALILPSVSPLSPSSNPEEDGVLPVVLLPPAPEGPSSFAPWKAAFPAAIACVLPEGCPHVLALAGQGKRLRRLVLDALPPALAAAHDFDFPLPNPQAPGDAPPKPFTLNLPLPDEKEIAGRVDKLMKEVRGHFPNPETALADALDKHSAGILEKLNNPYIPAETAPRVKAALEAARAAPQKPPPMPDVAGIMARARERLAAAQALALEKDPDMAAEAKFARAGTRLDALERRLAKAEAIGKEGRKQLDAAEAAFAKGELPNDIKKALAEHGVDPDALKQPTREEVEAWLASGRRDFTRKNLCGLDLSGLDFSGADFSHALCSKTNFSGCRMGGADFTFTVAGEADFSGAFLRGTLFKQAVLQKAVLRGADCAESRWELVALQKADCAKTVFDRARIRLSTWDKAVLAGARFAETDLSLSAFGETDARGADFTRLRCHKCLFRQTPLEGASFREATLSETLFQGASGRGLSFAGASLRKLYMDMDADFSGADFSGTDMREASLRMSRLAGARFSGADLAGALVAHCDLSRARLDGLRGAGCRFLKCDLSDADVSGANLAAGTLRKCRLTGADLSGANLYAANLRNLVAGETDFTGANLRRTVLEGKVSGKLEGLRP